MMLFGIGDLVYFVDLDGTTYLSVILADGRSGYGSDTRTIYIIYSFSIAQTMLAYHSEIFSLDDTKATSG